MSRINLQPIADTVLRRAQRQGFVLARHVREELSFAGRPPGKWKDVLDLVRPSLRYRQGRYYYAPVLSPRKVEEERHQDAVHRVTRLLIRQHRQEHRNAERRQQGRVDFILPVRVQTEDGRVTVQLSRDLSTSGIRLIGTRTLLGQKVRVYLPREEGSKPWCLVVRFLWTGAIGDGLYENGGSFLEVVEESEEAGACCAAG